MSPSESVPASESTTCITGIAGLDKILKGIPNFLGGSEVILREQKEGTRLNESA